MATTKLNLEKTIARLGEVPEEPQDFPRLYCEKDGIKIDLAMNIVEDEDASSDYDPVDETVDDDEDYDEQEHDPVVLTQHVGRPTLVSLRRDLRLCNYSLGLGYPIGVINDALDHYMERRCTDRVAEIYKGVAYDPILAQTSFIRDAWEELAFAMFDEVNLSTPAQIAVMQGMMWQSKRKMTHREVQQHYMWVLIGRQGSGKSVGVAKILSPLKDAHKLNVNFEMLLDQRFINLWRYNFVMFLDEMQKAGSSDREAIKAMITAPYLVRRPMRTNVDINVAHNASFVGASNRRLPDMIKDTTGIRRFVPTQVRDRMDWDVINQTNYADLWRSVNEFSKLNPAMEYWDEIAALQELNRVKTTVEEWAFLIGESEDGDFAEWTEDKEVYEAFNKWEASNYPKQEKTIRRYFYQELNDLCDQSGNGWRRQGQRYKFEKNTA